MTIRFASRSVTAITVLLTLTACGGKSTPAAESPPPSSVPAATSSAGVVTPASIAAPVAGERPTREFLIGKWGTDGDCTLAIDLRADGTSDGPFGNWTYNDGVIGFVEEPDFKVRVTVIDDKTMESTNDSSDKISRMTRCP